MTQTQFDNFLKQILSARYGEDVRQSIHDALQGMDEIVNTNTKDATAAAASANSAASAANTAAGKANTAASGADSAKTAANNAASAANTATTQANAARDAANTAASKASSEAEKATTAATQANEAKDSANEAASAANTATTQANAARDAANTAASKASSEATNATAAANRANTAAEIIESLEIGDINAGDIATKDYLKNNLKSSTYKGTYLSYWSRFQDTLVPGQNLLVETNQGLKRWNINSSVGGVGLEGFQIESHMDEVNGVKFTVLQGNTDNNYSILFYRCPELAVIPTNTNIVFSLEAFTGTTGIRFQPHISASSNANKILNEYRKNMTPTTIPVNTWTKLSVTFSTINSYDGLDLSLIGMYITIPTLPKDTVIYIRNMKLEIGTVPTEWTPSPLDRLVGGGRNYALGTSEGWSEWFSPTYNAKNVTIHLPYYAYLPFGREAGDMFTTYFEIAFENVKVGNLEDVPFLFQAQGEVDDGWEASNVIWDNNLFRISNVPPANSYMQVCHTAVFKEDKDMWTKKFNLNFRCDNWGNGKVRVRRIKIERGPVPSEWSPAPEDFFPDALTETHLQKLATALQPYLSGS